MGVGLCLPFEIVTNQVTMVFEKSIYLFKMPVWCKGEGTQLLCRRLLVRSLPTFSLFLGFWGFHGMPP